MSPDRLLQTALGQRASQALLNALKCGVFTELARGPRTARQLRRALLPERITLDLLDALVAMNILDREGDDAHSVYVNSREAGLYLDKRSPSYLGAALAAAAGASPLPGNPHAHVFDAMAVHCDFGSARTLLYIDGNGAELTVVLKQRHPHLRVERTELASTLWPAADAIVLVGCLGARPTDIRELLIRRAHFALPVGGCLVAIEAVIDDSRRKNLFALLVSLATHQRDGTGSGFSTAEFEGWCKAAGFQETGLMPLGLGCDAAIARK